MSKAKLHTFTINMPSEDDNSSTWSGQFTSRKLSILDISKVQRRRAELNGGMFVVRDDNGNPTGQGIDEEADQFNYMIAVLEVVLIQKPTWFDLNSLGETSVVAAVFKEVMDFENSFRRRRGTENQSGVTNGSSETAGTQESETANSSKPTPKVVDKQVQASLDA